MVEPFSAALRSVQALPGHADRIESQQNWQEDVQVIHAEIQLPCHKWSLK